MRDFLLATLSAPSIPGGVGMHLSGDNRGGRSEIRLTVAVDVDWGVWWENRFTRRLFRRESNETFRRARPLIDSYVRKDITT